MNIIERIREDQRTQGLDPCFASGKADICGQPQCTYRADCLFFKAPTRSSFFDLQAMLMCAAEGSTIQVPPGSYKGPFVIDKKLTIFGSGKDSLIFAADVPAIQITAKGVHLENLAVERTVGGDSGQPAVVAQKGLKPSVRNVHLYGTAEGVKWLDSKWAVPAKFDLGKLVSGRIAEFAITIEVGGPCEISTDIRYLQIKQQWLDPGPHTLKLQVNGDNVLPGTPINGSIKLNAGDVTHSIAISGIFSGSQQQLHKIKPTKSSSRKSADIAQDAWGFNITSDRAMEKLFKLMKVAAPATFSEQQELANDLLASLIGDTHYPYYLRNKGTKNGSPDSYWELILAMIPGSAFPDALRQQNSTILLRGFASGDGRSCFKIREIWFNPIESKAINESCGLFFAKLYPGKHIPIPDSVFAKVDELEIPSDHFPTSEQLEMWERFLAIERIIAEQRQFCIYYTSNNVASDSATPIFQIEVSSASITLTDSASLTEEQFWSRAKKARNDQIKFSDRGISDEYYEERGTHLGDIVSVEPDKKRIRIRLDQDLRKKIQDDDYKIPSKGYLIYDAAGNLAEIDRKRKALKFLESGDVKNARLGDYFFDITAARTPNVIPTIDQSDLLLKNINTDQKIAVEKAMAAPDICLIQGPPGTGKTTVIAEICYQAAREGKKTLIASQTNLAVDNALSRLVHSPIIHALRLGREDRVEKEGEKYLEGMVIDTWLNNTANHCEEELSRKQQNVAEFEQLIHSSSQLDNYLKIQTNLSSTLQKLERTKSDTLSTIEQIRAKLDGADDQISTIENHLHKLKSLITATESDGTVGYSDFDELAAYIGADSTLLNFSASVTAAAEMASKCGLDFVQTSTLEMAVRLLKKVPAWHQKHKQLCQQILQLVGSIEGTQKTLSDYSNSISFLNQLEERDGQVTLEAQQLATKIAEYESISNDVVAASANIDAYYTRMRAPLLERASACLKSGATIAISKAPVPSAVTGIMEKLKTDGSPWLTIYEQFTQQLLNHKKLQEIHTSVMNSKQLLDDTLAKAARHTKGTAISAAEINSGVPSLAAKSGTPDQVMTRLLQQAKSYLSDLDGQESFFDKIRIIFGGANRREKIVRLAAIQVCSETVLKSAADALQSFDMNAEINRCTAELQLTTQNYLAKLRKDFSGWIQSSTQALATKQQDLGQIKREHAKHKSSSETLKSHLESSTNRLLALAQSISKGPGLPVYFHKYLNELIIDDPENYEQIITSFDAFTRQLETLEKTADQLNAAVTAINLSGTMKHIQEIIVSKHHETTQQSAQLQESISKLNEQVKAAEQKMHRERSTLDEARSWWEKAWQSVPERIRQSFDDSDLHAPSFLNLVKASITSWGNELEEEKQFLNRYQLLVSDWSKRIRTPSQQDRDDLFGIYRQNANVIGITCSQAASWKFSKEFREFDVVIIDEVSKCTPPELLIPAIKAEKLVLVGDSKQLPPMFRGETLKELAESYAIEERDFGIVRESMFKRHYEACDENLKHMLTVQYRMHDSIMGVINQFYEYKLECGLLNPDQDRAHNIAGPLIKDHHHIVWVKTPIMPEYHEKRDGAEGTSFYNEQEVKAIMAVCRQLEESWAPHVAKGKPRKQIGIITFYLAQLKRIETQIAQEAFPSLDIRSGTVDRFQGIERQVILVSLVRNNTDGKVGFAEEPERINVAFSRAQQLLVIIGCQDLFADQRKHYGKWYSDVAKSVMNHNGAMNVSAFLE